MKEFRFRLIIIIAAIALCIYLLYPTYLDYQNSQDVKQELSSISEKLKEENPNWTKAQINNLLGATLTTAGRPDEGIPMVEKAMRLSPQDPLMNEFLFTIGSAHFMAERYEEAIEYAQRSLDMKPDQPGAWRIIAAASALLGKMGEARRAVGQMVRLAPDLTEERLRVFLRDEDVERYVKGLRLSGWTG